MPFEKIANKTKKVYFFIRSRLARNNKGGTRFILSLRWSTRKKRNIYHNEIQINMFSFGSGMDDAIL